MKDQTILPAQPGFFVVSLFGPFESGEPTELRFTPVIAWRVKTDDSDQVFPVTPDWRDFSEGKGNADGAWGVRYPDGQTWTGDWTSPAGTADEEIIAALMAFLPASTKRLSVVSGV